MGVEETQHEKCLGLTLRCSRIRGILLRSNRDGDRFKCEEYGQGVRMVEKIPCFADGRTGFEFVACTELSAWVCAKTLSKGFELHEPSLMRFSTCKP